MPNNETHDDDAGDDAEAGYRDNSSASESVLPNDQFNEEELHSRNGMNNMEASDNENNGSEEESQKNDEDCGDVTEMTVTAEECEVLDSLVTGNRDYFEQNTPHFHRRVSEPRVRSVQTHLKPTGYFRRASMTDFIHLKRHLNLPPHFPKAGPAQPVVTDYRVRVVEPPALSPVFEESDFDERNGGHAKRTVTTSQIVRSGASTYQMVWEDSPCSSVGEEDPLLENRESWVNTYEGDDDSILAHVSGGPSPMGHIQTKLAEWSWAREQDYDDDDPPRWIPLMAIDDYRPYRHHSDSGQYPPAPPNTKNVSGASSTRHSGLQSPNESDFVDEEDTPLEVHFKAILSQPVGEHHPQSNDDVEVPFQQSPGQLSITVPNPIQRNLSNVAEEDEHFRTHRNSVDLARRNLAEHKMNHELISTRDSFLLTRSKYDSRYPKHSLTGNTKTGAWSGFGGLSPIMDSSPPEHGRFCSEFKAAERAVECATSPVGLQDKARRHPGERRGRSESEIEKLRGHDATHRGKKR